MMEKLKDFDYEKTIDAVDPRYVIVPAAVQTAKMAAAPAVWSVHALTGVVCYLVSCCCCVLCVLIPGIDCMCCIGLCFSTSVCFWCCILGCIQACHTCGIPDPTNIMWWIRAYQEYEEKEKGGISASSAPRREKVEKKKKKKKKDHSSSSSSSSDDEKVSELVDQV